MVPVPQAPRHRRLNFVLALTVGLLIFLVLDTLLEAVEIAGGLPGAFSGVPMVILVVLLTLFGLLGVERLFRRGREGASRLATSYRIALGIGLHNLGEGLAIGAAFALGEAALGTFLILGFTLHNITEGVGIAAPVLQEKRPQFAHFAALALLGGGTGYRRDLDRGLRLLEPPLCRLPRRRGRGNTAGRLRGGTTAA